MEKFDFKKEYKELYKASAKKMEMVTVPKLNYLMIDGHGDPNNSEIFQQAINALFSVSYTIKFMLKKGKQQIDYGVMPLEGLWWTDDMSNFQMQDKSTWKWTIMIMQPEFVTPEIIEQAKELAAKRKALPMLNSMRLETMNEGLCAQVLYIGPYA
ncbi:MAG: GyrI-like domain-containing protein, partial [Sphingobacteriales bacterium]